MATTCGHHPGEFGKGAIAHAEIGAFGAKGNELTTNHRRPRSNNISATLYDTSTNDLPDIDRDIGRLPIQRPSVLEKACGMGRASEIRAGIAPSNLAEGVADIAIEVDAVTHLVHQLDVARSSR